MLAVFFIVSVQKAHAASVATSLVGSPETVFVQTRETMCSEADWIDSPLRVWYPREGGLRAITASSETYFSEGATLETLQRKCEAPIQRSEHNPDYNAAKDNEFPVTIYSTDGWSTYALVHNEWHRGCGGSSWVNSITVMQSSDGGRTFSHPDDYLVRGPPVQWNDSYCGASGPTFGSFNPSNIVKHGDWYYAMFGWGPPPGSSEQGGTCVMRTQSIPSGSAWQVWHDGSWKSARNTYTCTPVITPWGLVASLTYNNYFQKFLAVRDNGVLYVSDDLVNWTEVGQIPNANYPYLALINSSAPNSSVTGRNYENTGQIVWLYFAELTGFGGGGLPRYLKRQQIRFDGYQPPPSYTQNAPPALAPPPSSASCTLDTVTLATGDSHIFYSQPIVPIPGICMDVSQVRTCTDGTLTGLNAYQYARCIEGRTSTSTAESQTLSVPAVSCPSLMRNLSLGARGSDVVVLQRYLIAQKFLAAGNDTGYFGRLTQTAVQAYQRTKGIVSSGSPGTTGYGAIGPRTRAALARCL